MKARCLIDHEAAKLDDAVWSTFRYDGIQADTDDDGNPAPLELRTCRSCGSTFARKSFAT